MEFVRKRNDFRVVLASFWVGFDVEKSTVVTDLLILFGLVEYKERVKWVRLVIFSFLRASVARTAFAVMHIRRKLDEALISYLQRSIRNGRYRSSGW
jgi:hypothetical protein